MGQEPKRVIRGLIVTHRCNFRCRYCYVTRRGAPDMTADTARQAISAAFAEAGNGELLELDFLGGEPLCAFETIRQAAEWTWAQEWGREYLFFATTNGSVLDEEMKRWFWANRARFVLCLSFDGAEEGQRENRDARLPDVDFFLNAWPDQALQMTVTARSAGRLADNVADIVRRGGMCRVNCEYGAEPWPEEAFRAYERQLAALVRYYLAHPEKPPVNVIAGDLSAAAQSALDVRAGRTVPAPPMCGLGRGYAVTGTDGTPYLCQLLSPLTLDRARLEELERWRLGTREDFSVPACRGCPLALSCPACYGTAYVKTGDPFRREYNRCRVYRAELMAGCKFQAGRLSAGLCRGEEAVRNAQAIRVLLEADIPPRGPMPCGPSRAGRDRRDMPSDDEGR